MGTTTETVLVVDDEPAICWGFEQLLTQEGYKVLTAGSAEEGLKLARRQSPSMVVLDVRLPGEDGLTALPKFRQATHNAPCVVITAFGDLETAVKALQGGAADYLIKPFRLQDALQVCRNALASRQSDKTIAKTLDPIQSAGQLLGGSAAMQAVYRQIAIVANSDLSVLITGETGTGKELVAAAIHEHSARRNQPYLPIAPVALNPSLIESELFGHAKGAFTGAIEQRQGLFALAEGGTILLDEIGDLPIGLQVKLLRVLEQRQYTPVGEVRPHRCDVRILAATHCDLKQACATERFREDLYYRLAAVHIHLPPLRDRLEDLEILAPHFLQLAGHPQGGQDIEPRVLDALRSRPWHGNLRELRNAIEHAAVMSRGRSIAVEHLPPPQPPRGDLASSAPLPIEVALKQWIQRELEEVPSQMGDLHDRLLRLVEPPLLQCALEKTGGNRVAAAELLGIHRGTLRDRMQRYGIGKSED